MARLGLRRWSGGYYIGERVVEVGGLVVGAVGGVDEAGRLVGSIGEDGLSDGFGACDE